MSLVTKRSGHVGARAGREQCNINNIQRCRDYTLNPDKAVYLQILLLEYDTVGFHSLTP